MLFAGYDSRTSNEQMRSVERKRSMRPSRTPHCELADCERRDDTIRITNEVLRKTAWRGVAYFTKYEYESSDSESSRIESSRVETSRIESNSRLVFVRIRMQATRVG